MAKKTNNRLLSFLNNMSGGFVLPKTVGKTTLDTDGDTSVSPSERKEIIKRISDIADTMNPRRGGMDSYGKYIKPLSKKIAQLKLDNESIRVLAPEIRTAENLVIPSIMSPTEMRDGDITILSKDPDLDSEQNDRITKLLDKHFNKDHKLSTRLPEWIREALYGAGSKPILVLPITEIDIIMNDPTAIMSQTTKYSYSTESLTAANNHIENPQDLEAISIFGISDSFHKKALPKNQKEVVDDKTQLRPAIESAIVDYVNSVGGTSKTEAETSYNLEGKFKGKEYSELNDFAAEAIEALSIVDNPDILKADKARKSKTKAKITQQIITQYKQKSVITINQEVGDSIGNPVVYELPPESVIPIFTPGTPTEHIGYFICIDEFGNPVHVDDNLDNNSDNRRTSPGALYKSFGVESHFYLGDRGSSKTEKNALMVNIYQTIIDAHLKGRLKKSGIDNAYIGATESVYKCMFARYLTERKTKLLFVPKDFMTYYCFKHNNDGTGRSQLEDIKFILSLKITLMICRMMAAMNSAINRKEISINFTEEMGDPVQYMEMLKKEAINKSMVNFSYDPSDITRTLAEKSLSIKATGIPGAENFNVSVQPNEYRNITPDESLMNDVNNLMVFGLDIPPSAMNLLSENEFSRSVATNNLFFSRKTSHKQKIVCEHTTRYIQIYTSFSEDLKSQIKDVLNLGKDKKDKKNLKKTDGTLDESKSTSLDDRIAHVIKHIETTLPAPDIAPNKAEFEELDAMISSITTALEALFDNDLASDDPIPAIRALIKSDIIREYMTKIGVTSDSNIPNIDEGTLGKLVEFRHILANNKKAMADITKNTTAVVDDGSGSITPPDDTSTGGAPPDF